MFVRLTQVIGNAHKSKEGERIRVKRDKNKKWTQGWNAKILKSVLSYRRRFPRSLARDWRIV